MPEDNNTDVQPDAGQGGSNDSLYDLESVPEDYRPHVERIAKEMEGNVTRKFQEAADQRKEWTPYEELGIKDYQPEDIEQLLQFAEIASDENLFKEWWKEVGSEYGFIDSIQGEVDDDDDFEDDDDDVDPQQLLDELLDQKLAPFLEKERQSEEQQLIEEAESQIESELKALKDEHGEFDEDAVLSLALAHGDEDNPIAKGFEDYARIVGDTESNTITRKVNSPEPPEGPGKPNTHQPNPTDWNEVKDMARERLRASASQ